MSLSCDVVKPFFAPPCACCRYQWGKPVYLGVLRCRQTPLFIPSFLCISRRPALPEPRPRRSPPARSSFCLPVTERHSVRLLRDCSTHSAESPRYCGLPHLPGGCTSPIPIRQRRAPRIYPPWHSSRWSPAVHGRLCPLPSCVLAPASLRQ